jgi:2-hydroxycyclohexanecarboxyl-CoA dehydrogenase
MGEPMVALVTGAAGGLGQVAARRLAADGHRVAVNDIADDGRLRELAGEIGGIAVPGDIADPHATAAMVARTAAMLGPVQVLVANAAAMAMSPFPGADPAQWWRQVEVNLSGHFRLIQAVVPGMRAAGHGRIIVIASGWGVIGHPNATAYAASKAGLIALTKSTAREYASRNITANAVAPGYVPTELTSTVSQEFKDYYMQITPLKRYGTPEDVAAAIAFLCSPEAGYITGQTLAVDGGISMA